MIHKNLPILGAEQYGLTEKTKFGYSEVCDKDCAASGLRRSPDSGTFEDGV